MMSEEIEDLEKRLENLKPLEPEALAGRILDDWQMIRGEGVADALFARPRRRFASFSLCSACIGAIAGAAATFLGMSFLLPPKVEIREVVREVHAKAEPEAGNNAKPESELAARGQTPALVSGPPESGPENQALARPKARRNLDDEPTLSGFSFRDLDALVAQRDALARQMGRHDSPAGSTSGRFVPPRISPEEYRELLRELRL